jgi:formamidopyrimidine-DNA glycosylase
MPELAEVEFNRKQWDGGLRQKIVAVHLNHGKRIFRGVDTKALVDALTGATFLSSEAHGKQMVFRFSGNVWLGLHLGMTGELSSVKAGSETFAASKHDHLVLRQAARQLVFNDPRQFGRVLFHVGKDAPAWWSQRAPGLLTKGFSLVRMKEFLTRRGRAPIKAVLLMQEGFPGIGNWMADEVLWQAGIHPRRLAGKVREEEAERLHKAIKHVSRTALRTVGVDYRDLPSGWLFGRRWKKGGQCPKDGAGLRHATIGGRTTCWCPKCQPK